MKLPVDVDRFRVRAGAPVILDDWPTSLPAMCATKSAYRELLSQFREEIGALQGVLYADGRWSLLLIIQGMDTAGKDGVIKHVMSGVSPQGTHVVAFGPPSAEELRHDFLWRALIRLPERGRIGIFNRSYYEEVLIARVDPDVLARQPLPPQLGDPDEIWRQRYRDIVNVEDYLTRNGTRILKIFLHLSKEEQRQRLLSRIDDPKKNWKLSPSDLEGRRHWLAYRSAYEDALASTSTDSAPWYAVPADDKRNARLLISKLVVDALKNIPFRIPTAGAAHRRELETLRRELTAGAPKRGKRPKR